MNGIKRNFKLEEKNLTIEIDSTIAKISFNIQFSDQNYFSKMEKFRMKFTSAVSQCECEKETIFCLRFVNERLQVYSVIITDSV